MLDPEDEGTRIGVWVMLGVVFFVLVGVMGGVLLRGLQQKALKNKPAVSAEALVDVPLSGELLTKLYFESGVAALPADAAAGLDAATKALVAAPARKLMLAGFHDSTGDPKMNTDLAKQRALAARKALLAAGADGKRIVLRKPESTAGDGSLQEARRVEVRLLD